ncbi:MAG: metallophosphoesterase [Desulfotalea sp.]|nr:MAG: metallophosphoesterase [Desulfotalea sp.]
MIFAILADVHGNFEALEAVSEDVRQFAVDRVVCLGDNVGYGPEPDEVVTFIRRHGYDSVLGNHEFALCDPRARRWLNFQAAENNQITKGLLSKENLEFSCKLPLTLEFEGGYFVHAFPRESVFRYLSKQNDARIVQLFRAYSSSVFFVGHTHALQLVFEEDAAIVRRELKKETLVLEPHKKYIVNCGSVGQPRDGDRSAKYVLWDTVAASIEVRFVAYDAQKTMEKIRKCGFPQAYALRLG